MENECDETELHFEINWMGAVHRLIKYSPHGKCHDVWGWWMWLKRWLVISSKSILHTSGSDVDACSFIFFVFYVLAWKPNVPNECAHQHLHNNNNINKKKKWRIIYTCCCYERHVNENWAVEYVTWTMIWWWWDEHWACTFCQMISETMEKFVSPYTIHAYFRHIPFVILSILNQSECKLLQALLVERCSEHTEHTSVPQHRLDYMQLDWYYILCARKSETQFSTRVLDIWNSERDKCIM